MPNPNDPFRILIASSHALFGHGLRSILESRWHAAIEIVALATTFDEARQALATRNPDLLIVDYDDRVLNREEILTNFIQGENDLRVVLLSLKSGRSGEDAIVYDRKTLTASRIEEWLQIDLPNLAPGTGEDL
jgi:chemotaxis response regulator CheB